jgi:hypothetical protein
LEHYRAAAEHLRQVRDEAVAGVKDAQDRGDLPVGKEWVSKLQKEFDAFKAFREGLPRDVLLSIHADRILESFSVDKDNFVNLVIPADVSDEEAMHALNARYRELFPGKGEAAISERDMQQILDAGGGSSLRGHAPRILRLIGVVPGTTRKTHDQQAEALKQKGLMLPHPIDQALASAACACKRRGAGLFNHLLVRGSVPGLALYEYELRGVIVFRSRADFGDSGIAASGSSSPE